MKLLKTIIVLTALLFGFAVSAVQDKSEGPITSPDPEWVDEYSKYVKAFKSSDCTSLLALRKDLPSNDTLESIKNGRKLHYAYYLMQGVCFKQDYKEAAKILHIVPARIGIANANARLGALYLRGLGVKQNKEKALELFKIAALQKALEPTVYLPYQLRDDPNNVWAFLIPRFEGISLHDMSWNYSDFSFGTWDTPKELTEITAFYKNLPKLKESHMKAHEIAQHLQKGTGGYPYDPFLAWGWRNLARYTFGYPVDHLQNVNLGHSPKHAKMRHDFDPVQSAQLEKYIVSNSNLSLSDVLKTNPDSQPLMQYAYCLLKQVSKDEQAHLHNGALYYFASALQKSGVYISDKIIQEWKTKFIQDLSDDKNSRLNLEYFTAEEIEEEFNKKFSYHSNARSNDFYYILGDIPDDPKIVHACWPYFENFLTSF